MHRLIASVIALGVLMFGARAAWAQAENYNPVRVDSGLSGTYVSASPESTRTGL